MKILNNSQLKAWICSNQQVLPVLVLINPEFGIRETEFVRVAREYWPGTRHFRRIPDIDTINNEQDRGNRIVITAPSLELLIKRSKLQDIPLDEIENLITNLLVLDYTNSISELNLKKEFIKIKKQNKDESIFVLPYSKNLADYIETFKGPDYFIEMLIRQENKDRNWPVFVSNNEYYICVELLLKRFKEIFGFELPFKNIEVKRWVWNRSVKTYWQKYIGGRKYRKFTKWAPVVE